MSEETSVVRTIGRFHAVDELGRGGMGIVYRGYDPVIGRTVALKTIGFSTGDDEARQLRQRLYREASAAGTLSHANIVTVYDVIEDGDTTAVAMEFVEGQTLDALISQRGALPLDQALDLFGQICAALDYAGAKGIVHRDIKPANILITAEGQLKITDFGIARLSMSGLTQTGTILGSPSYMSPEQVKGLTLDSRSDLFSAAVVLFQMLTGERPFAGTDVATTMYRIVNEPPPPLETFNQTISPAVTAVLHRALAKEPGDRYQSGADFFAALRQAIQGIAAPAFGGADVGLPPAAAAKKSRLPLLLVAGGGTVIVLALLAIMLGGGGSDQGSPQVPEEAPAAAPYPMDERADLAAPASGSVQVSPVVPQGPSAIAEPAPGAVSGPVSTVPAPGPASTVPSPAPPDPVREAPARPPSRSTPAEKPAPAQAARPLPQAAEAGAGKTEYRETRREPGRPAPPSTSPPAAPPPAAPPPASAPVSSDAQLSVMFEGPPYQVTLYADDAVVGRAEQAGAVVSVQPGTVRLRAVNDAIYLNADLGALGLRPGERKALSLPGTASAVLAVRGENYQGVRILIDGRQVPGPYPAQVPRIAAGTHRVTFRWLSGSAAGQELASSVTLTSGGHFVIRAVLENADVVVQQVR